MHLNSVLNVKVVVASFNQEKALVGPFSVITNFRMELFQALLGLQITFPYGGCEALLRPQSNLQMVQIVSHLSCQVQ